MNQRGSARTKSPRKKPEYLRKTRNFRTKIQPANISPFLIQKSEKRRKTAQIHQFSTTATPRQNEDGRQCG